MGTSIRIVAGMLALACVGLASTAEAQVGETGKLRLTGGVNTVDGVAGGGLTPWAVIGSNATADQVGAAPFGTVVKSKDYQLGAAGGAVGIRDRVELSFARQDFDTMATGTALGLPNLHLKQNIYGVKVKLFGNAILNQDTWVPQMAAGALYKAFLLALLLGAAHVTPIAAADDDLYVAFGEKAGLAALMDDFVDRLVADSRTRPFFEHADLVTLKTQLTDQLCAISGGPCQYNGRDMKTAHEGMGVRTSHFNALVEVLQQSMDAKNVPFTVQNRMLARLAPMHREIITK